MITKVFNTKYDGCKNFLDNSVNKSYSDVTTDDTDNIYVNESYLMSSSLHSAMAMRVKSYSGLG